MSHSTPITLTPKNLDSVYHGKVRDVYFIKDKLVIIASNRISAFDHILPKKIPYKGQLLNQTAAYFLNATRDICPNWLLSIPHPKVSIGLRCEPIKLEMVIRGYLAGHSWRMYAKGERKLCGANLPENLKEGDKFPKPIITPATKAEEGHDEDISKSEILDRKIVTDSQYALLEKYTYALFDRGTEMAKSRGLILVDTKYEFGIYQGQIYLIDEIHTPDSSRYYLSEGYSKRQECNQKQIQISKEFVREWLMEQGFQGKKGQSIPDMPESFIQEISNKYIQLYRQLTGLEFIKDDTTVDSEDIDKWLDSIMDFHTISRPKKYNIPVISAALYNLDMSRYKLRSGLDYGAPFCPHGHPFKWIGYDLQALKYVRFTKSVFKRLINNLDPEFVRENDRKHAIVIEEECCD